MTSTSLHGRYSNYHYCIVRECKNTSIKTPGKLWIRLPSEINMRNTWLKLAKRDPDSLSTETRLYFCEDHFDLPNDMENYIKYRIMGSVSRIRMKEGCLPTKFACQQDRKGRTDTGKTRPLAVKRKRLEIIKEYERELEKADAVTEVSSTTTTSLDTSKRVSRPVHGETSKSDSFNSRVTKIQQNITTRAGEISKGVRDGKEMIVLQKPRLILKKQMFKPRILQRTNLQLDNKISNTSLKAYLEPLQQSRCTIVSQEKHIVKKSAQQETNYTLILVPQLVGSTEENLNTILKEQSLVINDGNEEDVSDPLRLASGEQIIKEEQVDNFESNDENIRCHDINKDDNSKGVEDVDENDTDDNIIFAKNVMMQIRDIDKEQRFIAEKLISDVLFLARTNQLNLNSCISIGSQLKCESSELQSDQDYSILNLANSFQSSRTSSVDTSETEDAEFEDAIIPD